MIAAMSPFLQRLRDEILFPVNEGNLHTRIEQVRSRLKLYPTMMTGQALLVVLFCWLMWDAVPHSALLLWGAAAYALYVVDMVGWWFRRDRLRTVKDCTRWHITFTVFTTVGGLIWGLTALWLFPPDQAHQALLLLVIMGLAAASATTNPTYPSSFYIYALCVVVPLIFRMASIGEEAHWAMAGIMCLYLAVVLKAGGELGLAFQDSLQQRFKNEQLVQDLVKQQAVAEQARRDAEAASREKSKFLAAASHDLRQPLQALTLFSEALKSLSADGEGQRLAGQIEKSVHALAGMFDELLDISRLDAGVVAPRFQHFELQPLLDRLYVDFAQMAQAKELEFIVPSGQVLGGIGTAELVIYSDPFLVERILRNLIANAIRYTEAGKVTLRCEAQGGMLKFEVEDTGIGISPEALPQIFDEYYQAGNSQRDRRKGLGLGLAIVRRIEKLLGYQIEVVSEQGRGSRFAFSVALGDPEQLSQPFNITHSKHDLSGVTVALVEDDPDIRQIVAELMQRWGCRVFAGELPHEVVRNLDAGEARPDVVVSDYRLPHGVTAVHVIAHLRELWGDSIPAIVLTGDMAPEVLHEIKASGAILLNKPVSPARLRSLMYLALQDNAPVAH